ncbi:membrane protein insertase YidC [Cognatishimia sp. 1_MG-2023]|uniref:membrane protein insertase YidC n=1 Tax=Cognatishimia sp. 1_MG-2023 TaxID=3062642 RepID=UPI0026E154F1|nr:membrane protein insertase YidC [Cognatishimia sp. 1_MG-2023]MDO6727725.1 membrane protein insertase YidC [Cognatishimia sp. 1_MG-2023]
MDDNNKNLILATVLSFVVILVWFVMFPPPEQPADAVTEIVATEAAPVAAAPLTTATNPATTEAASTDVEAPRVKIETARLSGSISLQGGRIDDLALKDYRETLAEDSETVHLFKPRSNPNSYYALYGWAPGAGLGLDTVPGANTIWTVESGDTLTDTSPVTLSWDNGAGLTFRREISIDANFMFSVSQSVTNTGAGTVSLAPYGILARHGQPADLKNFFILHEGLVSMSDGELNETDYDSIADLDFNQSEGARAEVTQVTESGWIGFTDHYWMATLIPEQTSPFKSVAKYDERRDIYQTEAVLPTQTLADGQTVTVNSQLFAGAKEWAQIRAYETDGGVNGFLDSIDWGWFFFLTKPMFALLHFLQSFIGNMGWSIIGLTVLIKIIVFPLAYKSYASMAKMKELQPEMEKIKEKAGDDRQAMQKAMMELYKKEKVNPASGCLPILIQIPVFFSLYKVIFVTLELRHAPWIGWINDLSAPDPTSILNLFGLLPYSTPEPGSLFFILSLGVLPILLGLSMWLQQKLNPAPTDPTQKMIFAWMPWIFMFMLGSFASGLVIYWIANNTITFIQQYSIMRFHGYKPDVFGNILSSFKRKPKAADE